MSAENFAEHFAHPGLRWSNDLYNWLVQIKHPVVALSYPKELRVPPGYTDPRFLTVQTYASALLMATQSEALDNKTLLAAYVINNLLMRHQVPTYFVGGDLLVALSESDPPEDMLVSELNWPAKTMLLMLPSELSKKATGGCEVVYISLAHLSQTFKSITPFDLVEPFTDIRRKPKPVTVQNQFTGDYMFMNSTVIDRDGNPAEYHSVFPITGQRVRDWFNYKIEFYDFAQRTGEIPFNAKLDKEIADRIKQIALQVLLAFNAAPELLQRETMVRPTKKDGKGRVVKRAVWQPNFIGKDYKLPTAPASAEPGSHTSPRAHFRRGHFRNQRFGPRTDEVNKIQRRLIWIQPVMVGV